MNGILIVDKPSDWTSMDVCAKLRGVLHERRIGHSGTLDPMATGVLAVFVGRATRAVEFCGADDKEYLASIRLGVVTDTQDITGRPLSQCEPGVDRQQLAAALERFTGDIQQIPPMYSAVKINGKKMYQLARKGVEVDRKARPVTIRELELLDFDGSEAQLRVVCSKGTYIRTLCHDIGQVIGCGACLSRLRRTRCGAFLLSDALTMDEIAEKGESALRPTDYVFRNYPAITLSPADERKCRCGNPTRTDCNKNSLYRVYAESGEFLMLGEAENGTLRTVKSFFEVN